MKSIFFSKFIAIFSLLMLINCVSDGKNQFYFEQAGTGETILFVHGSQEDYRVFMPQLELLKEDYNVITYSRRFNYPNTSEYHEGTSFSVESEAKDLAALIKVLKVQSVHLVGHSYGGLVAMEYAHKNPMKIRSISLSEPPLLRLPGCEQWYRAAQEGLIDNVASAFETRDTTQVMKALFEFFVGADIQEQIPPEVLQSLKANLTEIKALVNSEDPFPNLSTDFQVPVMLLTTGNTMPMLNCTNDALVKKMPGAKHVHLPDASHEMWMTHPEILANHLRDFVSDIPK
ncbi:alpha/beta fold hydrolase [Flagellimonas myxillae]|uniref:alpha/beta fold hydrolase n=1 Tax=Flagellimonas myxillae TaxID=2942214 RepID=UPI00201F66F1|nr:alpha/beta hydrolase [Muricauda myxillae]MCL6265854.1 alpha/beta hydrolase [Muricauda myxillae]